ncbi:hypothetical protein [Fervidobacterium thailandense]|uniref:Outer membrane protein beta-barrel domain-containing protein n=1 Tax=Fervidobacterium thailandense TaxID=1008305 RepID=A0A1E3G4J2_9BACT|nr:hypothetical protein [Fervidobacterium thailandense]ODN31164.1 hypothetical protein A4H02_02585 [Fervidobacterium thailandense]
MRITSVFLVLALSISLFAMEVGIGVSYSFTGQLMYFAELNTFPVQKTGPNTKSAFSLMFTTNFSNRYLLGFGGIAKYDINLEFGTVSLYGMGGMIVPVDNFGFDKVTSQVRVGAKYYVGNLVFNAGIYSLFLFDSTKLEGIEFSIGYAF